MGTARSARQKQEWFAVRAEVARRQGISLNEERIIAEFCLANTSTKKTAKEILKNMELAGVIKRLDGEILSPELLNEIYNTRNTANVKNPTSRT